MTKIPDIIKSMKILIPAAFGLEAVVKRQLNKLGYEKTPAFNGRIAVEGNWQDVADLNMFLRSGERALIEVANFKAQTFDELYDGIYSIRWEDWLDVHSLILLDGKSVKSRLAAIKASGSIVKKAIVRRLIDKNHLNCHNLDERGARTIVGFSIYEDAVSVTVDTSGEGLHKRGYRSLAYAAPLKETTAAALIDMSYYFPDKVFCDPFCGSGTLPIEAALKSLNIAAGVNRKFDYMNWKHAPKGVYKTALEKAKDGETRDKKVEILASDISENAVSIAKYHAKRAGVDGVIKFKVSDVKDFNSNICRGVLMCNPPYGARLGEDSEVKEIYKSLGAVYKNLPDWNAYILCGFPEFERYFGKRADKRKKIYNANIECVYYSYLSSKPNAPS